MKLGLFGRDRAFQQKLDGGRELERDDDGGIRARSAGTLPEVGAVVMVYAPGDGRSPHRPGPKAEPAVVLWANEHRDDAHHQRHHGYVRVALSEPVDRRSAPARRGEVDIKGRDARREAGLDAHRQVDTNRIVDVPWKSSHVALDGRSPVRGRLRDDDFEQLRAAYGAVARHKRRAQERDDAAPRRPAFEARAPRRGKTTAARATGRGEDR